MQKLIEALTTGPLQDRVSNLVILLVTALAISGLAIILFREGVLGKLLPLLHKPKPAEENSEVVVPAFSKVKQKPSDHPVFTLPVEFCRQIEKMDDGTSKSKVAVAFLRDAKFPAIYKHLRNFVAEAEKTKGKNLKNTFEMVQSIVRDYEKEALTLEIRCGNFLLPGVPPIWNERFAKWHEPHLDIFVHQIRSYIGDSYFANWRSTLDAILNAFVFIMWLTLTDAKKTLTDLNGDIDHYIEQKFCEDRQ